MSHTQRDVIRTFQIPQYASEVLPSGRKPSGIHHHVLEDKAISYPALKQALPHQDSVVRRRYHGK
jgi:hypothetical protein